MAIVKDRMAYQDFETARDAQERVIEQGWTKRTRTDNKKAKKKKDRDRQRDKAKEAGTIAPPGGGDDPAKQPISADLVEAVEKRNRLVQAFQPFFEEEDQGRYYGLPQKSVYDGLRVGEDDDDDDGIEAEYALQTGQQQQ